MWPEWSSIHWLALELIQFHPVLPERTRIETVTNLTVLARFELASQGSHGDLNTHNRLEHAVDVLRGAISHFQGLRFCRVVFACQATDRATHKLFTILHALPTMGTTA